MHLILNMIGHINESPSYLDRILLLEFGALVTWVSSQIWIIKWPMDWDLSIGEEQTKPRPVLYNPSVPCGVHVQEI